MSDETGGEDAVEDGVYEEMEAGQGPRSGVFAVVGLLLIVPGCLLAAFAALSGMGVGPFPGLLQSASGVIGFFPKDLMWGVGVIGAILALAGLVALTQAAQSSS